MTPGRRLSICNQGPDGQMYMIDWYDRNQCHHVNVDGHDRLQRPDVQSQLRRRRATNRSISRSLTIEARHIAAAQNDWHVRHARRVIQERGLKDSGARGHWSRWPLPTTIRRGGCALWALHAAGMLDEALVARGLANDDPHVRAWTIQLSCESRQPSAVTLARMIELAERDPSPVVRLYLGLGRGAIAGRKALGHRRPFARHEEDVGDHNLPLMIWYAAEPLAARRCAAGIATGTGWPDSEGCEFMARRVAAEGTAEALALGRRRRFRRARTRPRTGPWWRA